MKRYLYSFSVLFIISCNIYGQQAQSPQKKVYRAEDNKLFINKDLGVYIWISTSPDPGSEKFRLISDTSKRYTNPMYFDTEGYNTIRSPWCVDTATHKVIYPLQDIIFKVYADGLPPRTNANFISAEAKSINGKKYFGSDLKIQLRSTDAVSGIATIQYKLNETGFSDYKDDLTNLKEGENTLEYFAIDNVGNKEAPIKEVFYIDNTPPKTEYEIEGNRSDKYVSADASIKLIGTDNISGVKATFYKLNNGPFIRYTKPIPVSVLSNDEACITFYSEDNLGNKETEKSIGGKQNNIVVEGAPPESGNVIFEFYIDREPPQVTIDIDKDSHKGKLNYVSPRSQFIITAEDEKSGVDKILFSINSPVVDNQYTGPFALDKEGMYYLRVKATDYVGNFSPLLTRIYYCDTKAPVLKMIVGTPKFLSHDTLFIAPSTTLSLTATDDQSGVNSIQYALGKSAPATYIKPFNIDNPGLNTISFSATDNVNNKGAIQSQNVFLDNLPPVIIYHFSVESIGTKNVRDEVCTIYPTNAMLYIAATDASSGGEKINYRINGGPILYENPVKGFTAGNYVVEANAYDVLGNKSSQEIKFAIEK